MRTLIIVLVAIGLAWLALKLVAGARGDETPTEVISTEVIPAKVIPAKVTPTKIIKVVGNPAPSSKVSDEMFAINNTWMLVATFLVFIMHLGFACLETGLTRAKNTVNILFKNTAIVSIGILTYALLGFSLMYPSSWEISGWLGWSGFGIGTNEAGLTSAYNVGYTYWTDFLFQGMFAATAATIVSGAVAERIKLGSFLIFSTIYVAFVYPLFGSWKWGGGWLDDLGFYDFAGSTLVHSVGGWAALAGVIVLGPRLGKYVKNTIKPIMGHSMPLATIGVFLLWLGWFGFNGGSVLSADPAVVSFVFVTTTLAAAAGIMGAKPSGNSIAALNLLRLRDLTFKDDYGMTVNKLLEAMSGEIVAHPAGYASALIALDYQTDRSKEIVIIQKENTTLDKSIASYLFGAFIPNKIVVFGSPAPLEDEEALAHFRGKKIFNSKPTIYVCEQGTCKLPTNDLQKAKKLIGEFKPYSL